MNISLEYWLCLGLVGLYCFDSAKLISYNQLFLVCGMRAKWQMYVPQKNIQIFKQYLCFILPLHCTSLLFLSQWNVQPSPTSTASVALEQELQHITAMQKQLKKLSISSAVVWVLTLMICPMLYLSQQHPIYLFIALITIYVINVVHVALIYRWRSILQLSKTQCGYYLIDALFCPPFALNLLKKISLNYTLQSDATALAQYMCTQDEFNDFATQLIDEIEQLKLSEADPDSVYFQQLQQRQCALKTQIETFAQT